MIKPKSILTLTQQNLPIVLKFQEKEYIIRFTANGSLHMSKYLDKLSNITYNRDNQAKVSTTMGENE